ncbi:hypothetical protein RJ55_06263 [Drechmeria coniospora]|nr:hypothetical protein RJ55_06263 [Drechmeria coniospora]
MHALVLYLALLLPSLDRIEFDWKLIVPHDYDLRYELEHAIALQPSSSRSARFGFLHSPAAAVDPCLPVSSPLFPRPFSDWRHWLARACPLHSSAPLSLPPSPVTEPLGASERRHHRPAAHQAQERQELPSLVNVGPLLLRPPFLAELAMEHIGGVAPMRRCTQGHILRAHARTAISVAVSGRLYTGPGASAAAEDEHKRLDLNLPHVSPSRRRLRRCRGEGFAATISLPHPPLPRLRAQTSAVGRFFRLVRLVPERSRIEVPANASTASGLDTSHQNPSWHSFGLASCLV